VIRSLAWPAALIVALAGCSSSGGSAPKTSAAPTSSTATSTASARAAAIADQLRRATSTLTSAHVKVDAGAVGGVSTGNVAFAAGKTTASDFTLNLGGTTRIVTVGDTSYAKLPGGRNTSGKPWVVVSNNTDNEFVRALVGQVSVIKAAASIPAIADLVGSASSVRDLGNTPKGHHYALSLDMQRAKNTPLGAELATLGTDPLPVDLYLDAKGRPTLIKINAKLGTQPLPIVVTVGSFNIPVQIAAPLPGEVAR
jgi:hypothetical protein